MTTREQVLKDPTASNWLKDCLRTSEHRDTVNTLNDLEVLNKIIADECNDKLQFLEHQISQIEQSKLVDFDLIRCESL